MNVLRRDGEDDNLSTADLVNSTRNRTENVTPRQAYAAGLEPTHVDPNRVDGRVDDRGANPPDYTPPPQPRPAGTTSGTVNSGGANGPGNTNTSAANTLAPPPSPGPRPVATQIPPASPVASVPGPGPSAQSAAGGPVGVPAGATAAGSPGPLFPEDELHNFRARWDQVQTSFVDEPRKAVESADSLVATAVKRIAEQFANERENLEKQWDRGDNVNTEDLRQALKRYRAFFDRLLSV